MPSRQPLSPIAGRGVFRFEGRRDGFVNSFESGEEQYRWAADYCADGLAECRDYLVRCNTIPNASCGCFPESCVPASWRWRTKPYVCAEIGKLWAAMALYRKGRVLCRTSQLLSVPCESVRTVSKQSGIDSQRSFRVRWWIFERATRLRIPPQRFPSEACPRKQHYGSSIRELIQFPGYPRLALQRLCKNLGNRFYPTLRARGEASCSNGRSGGRRRNAQTSFIIATVVAPERQLADGVQVVESWLRI